MFPLTFAALQRSGKQNTIIYGDRVNKLQIPKLKIKRYSIGHSFPLNCVINFNWKKSYHKIHFIQKECIYQAQVLKYT